MPPPSEDDLRREDDQRRLDYTRAKLQGILDVMQLDDADREKAQAQIDKFGTFNETNKDGGEPSEPDVTKE